MHLHWAMEDHLCPSYPMSLCVLQYLGHELFFFFVNRGHLRVPFDVSPTSTFASNNLFFIDCAGCSADGEALPLSITSPPLFLERLDGAVAKELPKVPQENVGLAFGELPSRHSDHVASQSPGGTSCHPLCKFPSARWRVCPMEINGNPSATHHQPSTADSS